ncbi:MAG: hypothetical protein CM15mP22_0040 [Gammaproteobacteria bacterium]|nr:MAG: hypothetical protein CM15mP22_0040 [Gammaproteobacteria bacterium]
MALLPSIDIPVPAVYSVLVSVEDIVTAPAFSVIVTFDPAVKASVSPSAKVLPPAVTDRTVSVSVTVVDIALFPSIDIPVPAVYSVLVSVEDINHCNSMLFQSSCCASHCIRVKVRVCACSSCNSVPALFVLYQFKILHPL